MAFGKPSYPTRAAPQRLGLVLTLALHALAVAAILSHAPARSAFASAIPIMVSMITSEPGPTPKTPASPPIRPKTESMRPHPPEPLPLMATASETARAEATPAPQARELPTIDAAPIKAAPPPAVIAATTIPPRFDAAYLRNPSPAYPSLARRMREQGRSLLRVLVSAEGAAEKVELKTSSGSTRLDHAALDTVARWRFVPARQGERPVAAWVLVPISFSLEE